MPARSDPSIDNLVIPTDERRAAHEAGHVLAAIAVGWPFDYVTIDPDPQYPHLHGHVKYARRIDQTASYGDLKACIAAFLGGKYGELALLGNVGSGPVRDEETVMQLINDYYESGTRLEVYRQATQFVDAVLRDSSRAAEAIRDALLAHRQLSGRDAEIIVRETAGPEVLLVIQERDATE